MSIIFRKTFKKLFRSQVKGKHSADKEPQNLTGSRKKLGIVIRYRNIDRKNKPTYKKWTPRENEELEPVQKVIPRPEMFCKKSAPKIFAKFIGKHLYLLY